jgi:hypothetical protein
MSSGQYTRRLPMNKTIIRDGKIVRLNKDGSVRSVLGKYPPEKK